MFLIDTSVWIDYLRDKKSPTTNYFSELLDDETPFGITGIIYQELLQGAASKADFDSLRDYLGTQRFYHVQDDVVSYEAAAQIYFACRGKGITIRSTIDCLIAQIAIENELILLHNDEDYNQIAFIAKTLKSHQAK